MPEGITMNNNAIDWIYECNSHLATTGQDFEQLDYLDLSGNSVTIECGDAEHKGKTYYKGCQLNNDKFGEYPVITVSSQAHGLHTIATFDGYRDVLSNSTYTPPTKTPEQLHADKVKADAAKRKAENEAKAKAANVQREIEGFTQLSKTPTQSQNKYLTDKKIPDFANLTNCDIRYGIDKHGQFTAILLTSATTGQPVGVQKFYDRKLEKSNSNKDFTWGMKKNGACYQIGTIDDTTKFIAFCEGFADAILLYIVWAIPVVVTLDAGNIGHITSTYKTKYPNASGVVVCDNDKIGVSKGMAAAQQAGYEYVIPDFTGYDQSGKPKDIWDLWNLGGNDAVENLRKSTQYPQIQSTDTGHKGVKGDDNPKTSIPYGYRIENGWLCQVETTQGRGKDKEKKETLTRVYKGKLEILACEIDADTRNHKLVIQFQGNKGKLETASVPLEEVATGRGVIANLAKRGAKIQEKQAKLVSEYLIRFYEHNDAILPTNSTTQFLGISGDGIITPLRSVGTDTQYNGALKLAVGNDKKAYPNAIKEVVSWGEPAWPLLFTLSMSLISPFLPRLKLRRNPVIAFLGQSNSGKTTSALFANGVWGDSERAPLKIDGSGKATKVGIEQNFVLLNGLPCLLDEIHKMQSYMIETIMYEWANKQSRPYGSPDGTPKGSNPLNGSLLLCGEDLPILQHKGATNRLLMIDVATNPPLGVSGKIKNDDGELISNPEGARRAKVLEHAWVNGMGLLGADFSEYLINNWDAFYTKYQHKLKNINGELEQWAETAAISITTLEYLFSYLGINDNSIIGLMPTKIDGLLHEYRNSDKDPDIAAWDNLQTMIGTASEKTIYEHGIQLSQGIWQLNGENIWWFKTRRDGIKCFCVPIGTESFKRYVGAASKHTQSWLNSGLILGTGKNNDKVTEAIKPPKGHKPVKCILIPATDNDLDFSKLPEQNIGSQCGSQFEQVEVIDNKYINNNKLPKLPKLPTHAHTQGNLNSDDQSGQNDTNISNYQNSGSFGSFGSQCQKGNKKQNGKTLPDKLPAQKKAVVSGSQDQKKADPNNRLTQQIKQYLNKNGTGSLGDLINSLGQTEKSRQAAHEQLKYLESQGVVGIYDNQSGYISVFLVDRLIIENS